MDYKKIEKQAPVAAGLDPEGKHWPDSFPLGDSSILDSADVAERHNLELTLNYEPSRRLRLYQFDPCITKRPFVDS